MNRTISSISSYVLCVLDRHGIDIKPSMEIFDEREKNNGEKNYLSSDQQSLKHGMTVAP